MTKYVPLKKGMENHFKYYGLENPMKTMVRKKDRIMKDEFLKSVGAKYATGDQWRNN